MRQWTPRPEPQRTRKLGSGPRTLTGEALEEIGRRGKWDKKAELAAMEDDVAALELQ